MRTHRLLLSLAAGVTLLAGAALAQESAKPPAGATNPAQPAKPGEAPKGQVKPAPAPDSLEALMADALKHNPDVQAAQGRVREAELQLNKVRNEIMVQI